MATYDMSRLAECFVFDDMILHVLGNITIMIQILFLGHHDQDSLPAGTQDYEAL
jgi:hypothetical protein